ncbi:MAG: aromatic ring-hydroxylating oxygenase subunit alpha [Isosphaeraceae bacterium]
MTTKTTTEMSLPSRYYTDPAYYRDELEWYFGEMWFHAGRAGEIPHCGDFVVRQIGDDSLIVVRGDRGQISALFNVCRHRGTRLCAETSGRFAATIQCPYHAWTYDLSGNLVAAPHMERESDFRREEFPLVQAAVGEWAGHLFLNQSSSPAPLDQQIEGLDQRFRAWNMDQLRAGKRITYDVAANWKLIIHNYSECLHCPGVHPALQKLSHYLSGENEPPGRFFLGGRMRFREGIGTLSFDGRRRRACLSGLDENQCQHVYYYAFLPNFLLSLHPDYVMTHTLWPRNVGRTEIVCEWLFHPDAMDQPDFDPDDAVAFWDLTNRQDWHVCEEMQIGLKSRAYRPGPYSYREDLLPGFDRMILEVERRATRSRPEKA